MWICLTIKHCRFQENYFEEYRMFELADLAQVTVYPPLRRFFQKLVRSIGTTEIEIKVWKKLTKSVRGALWRVLQTLFLRSDFNVVCRFAE